MEMEDPSLGLESIVAKCTDSNDGLYLVKGRGETALATSIGILERLKEDGCDLIGSVESSSVVRTDRLLTQRTATEKECSALTEASSSHVNSVDVELQNRWTEAFSTSAPHQLTSDIKDIQEMSGEILSSQQELISRLRDEVNRAEQTIQQEIERQTVDLGVMRKRMKDHLDSTRATQRCQLREIDAAFGEDYRYLLSNHSKQLDDMLADWSSREDEILHRLNDIGQRWAADLNETDAYYYRECSRTRNTLTDDIQSIEQELEKLKTTFALNNEVLDYNCKVLKLREEERAAVILRHKRRINRLVDRYRALKEQTDKAIKSRSEEEMKVVKEIQQLRSDCDSMERKFVTIKTANDRQLDSVCQLAEERIDQLLNKLASIDERIFVEILEQPWDGIVGQSNGSRGQSPLLDGVELEREMSRLENHVSFLVTDTFRQIGNVKERLMKMLDIPDENAFRVLLTSLKSVPDRYVIKELTLYVDRQQRRPVDLPETSRQYLSDPASIRAYFADFKETAMPKNRLDMWKMLARALIQYERILRDRMTAAENILTRTKSTHRAPM